jgi:hypothetical protein
MKNTKTTHLNKSESLSCSGTNNDNMHDSNLSITTYSLTSSAPNSTQWVSVTTGLHTVLLSQVLKQWEDSAVMISACA